jgi:hypothetical protein
MDGEPETSTELAREVSVENQGHVCGAELVAGAPGGEGIAAAGGAAAERQTAFSGLRELAVSEPLRLRVVGTCMAPSLLDGSVVDVLAARWYWPGDIVAYLGAGGRLTVHRVIGYRPRGWRLELVTQADASPAADGAVDPGRVLGRVCPGAAGRGLAGARLRHRARAVARFVRLVGSRMLGR